MDLRDFYRGTLSSRRLGALVRNLSPDSALVRALNDGWRPWGQLEHLMADVWVALAKIYNPQGEVSDQPRRIAMEAKSREEAKQAKRARQREKFEKRKRAYGLG